MRCKPITFRHTLAAALTALALTAVVAPAIAPALADEAGDEEESEPRVRGRRPPVEPDAEPQAQAPVKGLGSVRRPDLLEAAGEPLVTGAKEAPPSARPDQGAVICEAGCDGPRGSVVYKPSGPPG
jgi:hypothetical protein